MKELLYLSGVINENQFHESKGKDGIKHYMFFSNLKTIKDMVDEILKMDQKMIDKSLDDGHDWASDHITSSRDDIEEVHNWVKSRIK
jgi:hypothetical protein